MITMRPLLKHPYAKCGLYMDSYMVHKVGYCVEYGFRSYNTKIIIQRGSRVIYTGKYSPTTSRQLTWWIDEQSDNIKGLTKKTLEIMYKEKCAYNYITGELEPLTHDELREIKEIRRKAFNYGYGW